MVLLYKLSRALPFFMALFFVSSISAQESLDTSFFSLVDRVFSEKPSNYKCIDSNFSVVKNDTVKMKFLAKRSHDEKYLEGESYALNMLGISYRNASQYDKAIAVHTQALEIAVQLDNLDLNVVSLNMLGVVYRRLDLIRGALDYHKQALDLAETVVDPSLDLQRHIAVSQNSMGNIYLALKQYDLALKQFNRSLLIEKKLKNTLGLAINYHNIGYAKERKGLYDEALASYEASLDYNNEIDSEVGRVICYNSIGTVYIKQIRYDEALAIINKAFLKAQKMKDQYHITSVYINLGWAQLKLNDLALAEANLLKGLEIAEDFNLKSYEIEAFSHLSELYEAKGEFEVAMNYYKKHIELDETLTNERNLQYVNDLIIKYESEQKNNQIKELANENEIVKLNLIQNRRMLLFGTCGAFLFIAILFVLHRQRQLKNEKKIITLEQDMLRSQMNPHFIFNTLSSIKLYVINNEKENAVYYLNKFSKLIRKILVASTEKEITLEEELETITLYMNIENIRFDNTIKFKVKIDEDVNTSIVKVPSLILQPFLENALWHGLSSKTENKQVLLEVTKPSQKYVRISITDNGIGRLASEQIKIKKTLKRKSLGIAITIDRLVNFSKRFTNDYSLTIEDLYDDNNVSNGTRVVMDVPVEAFKMKTA